MPWIAEEFAAVMDRLTERFTRSLVHMTDMRILDCRDPALAAHQFMGVLNEFSLWPLIIGRESLRIPAEEIVEETIRMFLQHYGRSPTRPSVGSRHEAASVAGASPEILPL